MRVSTVEEMGGLDARAPKEYGVPDYLGISTDLHGAIEVI